MAFFRCTGLDTASEAKVKKGTLNSLASNEVFVECGFEPTMIMVSSMSTYGNIASTDTTVYVKGATQEIHSFVRNTSNQMAQETSTNANARIRIASNGFYFKSRFTRTGVDYMAIG